MSAPISNVRTIPAREALLRFGLSALMLALSAAALAGAIVLGQLIARPAPLTRPDVVPIALDAHERHPQAPALTFPAAPALDQHERHPAGMIVAAPALDQHDRHPQAPALTFPAAPALDQHERHPAGTPASRLPLDEHERRGP